MNTKTDKTENPTKNDNIEDVPMPLTSHLGELRKRIVHTIILILIVFVGATSIELEMNQPILSAFRSPLDARNIPEQFPLTGNQEKYIKTLITGEPYINLEAIREELENLIYPHHYMDFETYSYSLPIVPNTGPWEQVPFQWSIHHLESSGDIINASTNPTLNTTINKNKTYLGAFDVILKILFGSKSLNIFLFRIFFC